MRSYPAIIVLGAARSGTKLLRDILGAPQGFHPTPFDANHIWRIGNASAPDDVFGPDDITARTRHVIRASLWKLACGSTTPAAGSVLVEKTVSNALRPDYVETVFPGARYVVLVRDGRDVVESSHRMWMSPPDRQGLRRKIGSLPPQALPYAVWYAMNLIRGRTRGRGAGLWGVRYRGIEKDIQVLSVPEVCALQWRTCVEASLAFAERAGSPRVMLLRYEELAGDERVLDRLSTFLELSDEEDEHVRAAWRCTVMKPVTSRWRTSFDEPMKEKILSLLEPVQAQLGYPVA